MKSLFTNRELRGRLMVVMIGLMIYKVLTHVTVPFLNSDMLEVFKNAGGDGVFGIANTFTGGAFSNFSVVAVGVMPYITASIMLQLLQLGVVPYLVELKSQGEYGRQRLKVITYWVTFVLAVVQSLALSFGLNKMYPGLVDGGIGSYLGIAVVMTLGTVILVVIGEWIDRKGVGKGISLLITAGIVSVLPTSVAQYLELEVLATTGGATFTSVLEAVILLIGVLLLVVVVIMVNGGERRVPIQYATQNGVKGYGRERSFLPIKLNAAGVMPVIFASAMVMVPTTLVGVLDKPAFTLFVNDYIAYTSVSGMLLYGVLIFVLSYFYAFIAMNPKEISDNLKMAGGYIPGYRQGEATERVITSIIGKLTFVGAFFLMFVSLVPMFVGTMVVLPQALVLGGTSVIILVSVAIDVWGSVKSYMVKDTYASRGILKGMKR